MLSRIFIALLFTPDNHLMGTHVNSIYFKEIVEIFKTYLIEKKIESCNPSFCDQVLKSQSLNLQACSLLYIPLPPLFLAWI